MTVTLGALSSLTHLPEWSGGATLPGVLMLHGHGANHEAAAQAATWAAHPTTLADGGAAVYVPDLNSPTYSWPSPAVMATIDAAYAALAAIVGGSPRVAIFGTSAGGGCALNWIKRNPGKVARAWLMNPLTDLDYAYGLAGYVPDYDTGGLTPDPAWVAELDSLFSGAYNAHANGYRIHDERATWRGLVPIVCSQADDDTVIPPAATAKFVADVADPAVRLRTVHGGGHTGFASLPADEVAAFLLHGRFPG